MIPWPIFQWLVLGLLFLIMAQFGKGSTILWAAIPAHVCGFIAGILIAKHIETFVRAWYAYTTLSGLPWWKTCGFARKAMEQKRDIDG